MTNQQENDIKNNASKSKRIIWIVLALFAMFGGAGLVMALVMRASSVIRDDDNENPPANPSDTTAMATSMSCSMATPLVVGQTIQARYADEDGLVGLKGHLTSARTCTENGDEGDKNVQGLWFVVNVPLDHDNDSPSTLKVIADDLHTRKLQQVTIYKNTCDNLVCVLTSKTQEATWNAQSGETYYILVHGGVNRVDVSLVPGDVAACDSPIPLYTNQGPVDGFMPTLGDDAKAILELPMCDEEVEETWDASQAVWYILEDKNNDAHVEMKDWEVTLDDLYATAGPAIMQVYHGHCRGLQLQCVENVQSERSGPTLKVTFSGAHPIYVAVRATDRFTLEATEVS